MKLIEWMNQIRSYLWAKQNEFFENCQQFCEYDDVVNGVCLNQFYWMNRWKTNAVTKEKELKKKKMQNGNKNEWQRRKERSKSERKTYVNKEK